MRRWFVRIGTLLLVMVLLHAGVEHLLGEALAQQVQLDLVPPTQVPGYAEGLQVGGGDLTRLVVLITNYVLGFLGLAAITAIIYAGVLYVANFGNDEMTGKAKSIILYVSIGILVIIMSYAIVNTLVGVVNQGGGGIGGAGSPGRVSTSDRPVTTLDSLFDVEGKDFVYPVITTLRELGDLCESTPLGLLVDSSGCSQNEIIPDTDSDGIANILDTDDDDDGVVDAEDQDDDGDGINDSEDQCPNTLSFLTFKVQKIEERKIQIDRVDEEGYLEYIRVNQGCAEYEKKSDLDGDGVFDRQDCDRDGDGMLDDEECAQDYFNQYPPGDTERSQATPETMYRGVRVLDVTREEIDADDDNDGVYDFSALLEPQAADLLLRQLANNFASLESFIRITCATLPQTRRVLDYCGYGPDGEPFGKLVRILDSLSSDLAFTNFDSFNQTYQEFLAIVQSFPRVQPDINATTFQSFLPANTTPVRISFDALNSTDPYQDFCPPQDDNYYWFVNKTLDFSEGLTGVITSSLSAPDGTGVFFDHDFTEPGVYNVQLLVRSACKFNTVNPGASEGADVDAAIAGLASARIQILPPRAQLLVRINGDEDPGSAPYLVLSGTSAPIRFDLTQSSTNRGAFESLAYECGNTAGDSNQISGDQSNWIFDCSYANPAGDKTVRLTAQDGEGDVSRTIRLRFSNVIADLNVQPGLQGTTLTTFSFDPTASEPSQQITNYTYVISEVGGSGALSEIDRLQSQNSQPQTYQFPSPGEYRVRLEVSKGGAEMAATEVDIAIGEQEPIAAFRIQYPENIRPARALFDGSLSFHPDFPDNSVLNFVWEVDGVTLQRRTATVTGPFTYEQETAGSDERIFYEFQTVGDHEVILTVLKGDKSDRVREETTVETLLGVDFDADPFAARVNDLVTFTPSSDKAVGYFWDFGDGDTQVADDQPVVHKYREQGEYNVELTAEDAAGNTNNVTKKVRVGLQNAPVAFVQVFVNSIEQDLTESDCIEVTRRDSVVFDASKSVNVAGETSGLSFLWEIEDIDQFNEIDRKRTVTRLFKELTAGGCIDVNLSVTDLSNDQTDSIDPIGIEVVNIPPEMTDVRYTVTGQQQVTPVTVNVSVVGARDLDGRVERYRWYYYEEGQGQKRLDQRVTDIARTTFVIGPNNVEGTESTYYFVVEVEDNDGAMVSSLDEVGPSEPLVVTNGPNVAPVAEFVTDRSTVNVNELIRFNSTTKDPLGEFIPSAAYQWDFQGDGEYERGVSGAEVTYRYEEPGVYTPTLKVTKNGLTSTYDMTIRVLPTTEDPEAAFIFVQSGARVKFISNSTVDDQLEDKSLTHAWDFDTTVDTDGNGIPDDDADSALLAPVYEFEGDRDVFVGLRVTDSVGNTDQVVRKIPFIVQDRERGPLGATQPKRLTAVLKTNPPLNPLDGKLYLPPPASDVIFNAKASQGTIQEYRIDTNIFVDSDGDGIDDNDVDNKTHPSWKDGSSFRARYREPAEGERIRAKLTVVSVEGFQKSQVVDIIFAEEQPDTELSDLEDPDAVLQLLDSVPEIGFDVSSDFASPGEELTFDASRTSFPDEQVEEYRWDFNGDGLVDEISFEPVFSYAYDEEGVYEVILEAVSDGGLIGEYSQTIFVRGGLEMPQADFSYELRDNEVIFANSSTIDPTLNPEEVRYEWTFTQLDLQTAVDWTVWEQTDELEIAERQFDLPSIWVKDRLALEAVEPGAGLLPRETVLGRGPFVARFQEGTTFANPAGEAFVGDLRFAEIEAASAGVEGEETVMVTDTGVAEPLALSDEVLLIYNGVVLQPKLYQLNADGSTELLGNGIVEDNLTSFSLMRYGGRYLLTGTVEASDEAEVEIGVSTVENPVKVFPNAGLYQVILTVTDPVGETAEKTEVITIDQNLELVEPGTVTPEELPGEQPVDERSQPTPPQPEPEAVNGDGLSFFWWVVIFVVLVLVVAVVVIVIKTIRQRQEELSSQVPAPKQPPKKTPPDEPAAKTEKSREAQQPPKAQKSQKPQKTPVVEPEVVEKKDSEEKAKKDDDDQSPPGSTSKGGDGPIPDWLKS